MSVMRRRYLRLVVKYIAINTGIFFIVAAYVLISRGYIYLVNYFTIVEGVKLYSLLLGAALIFPFAEDSLYGNERPKNPPE